MNDIADLPDLPPGAAESTRQRGTARSVLVLGPHDTARAASSARSCPVRCRSRWWRATAALARPAGAGRAAWAVCRAGRIALNPTCCASPGPARCRKPKIRIRSAHCWARSICICSMKGGISNLPSHLGANVGDDRRRDAACASPSGRRTRARFRVVGDFNTWDPRRNPMRLRYPAGVWELFIPRLAPGARYKYAIVGPDGCAPAVEGRSAGTRDRAAAGHRIGRRRSNALCRGTTTAWMRERARRHGTRRADLDLRNACRILVSSRWAHRRLGTN